MNPSWSRVVAIGVVLGLVAACVVWYLERFEVAKLHSEIGSYLADHDAFREWLKENRSSSSGGEPPPPPKITGTGFPDMP